MTHPGRLKVAVLGGDQETLPLLELLGHLHDIQIVGLSSHSDPVGVTPSATPPPIPVFQDPGALIDGSKPNLLIDTTGKAFFLDSAKNQSENGIEILGGKGARLLLDLAEQEHQVRGQISHTEKLATIGTMVLGIAHDINNPLHVILGFSENLCEEPNVDEVHEQAREIHQAAKRIITMCGDLTGYARQGFGQQRQMVDLGTQLDESLKIAHYATSFDGLSVIKSYSPCAQVLAKAEELTQIFVNLVLNAVHAMEGKGTLTLSSESSVGKVCIKVQDTGHGISPDHLPKIFEPFYTTKPAGKGTGLGLHSVRTLVQKNQGEIFVESQIGQGTCFHLEFPNPCRQDS